MNHDNYNLSTDHTTSKKTIENSFRGPEFAFQFSKLCHIQGFPDLHS